MQLLWDLQLCIFATVDILDTYPKRHKLNTDLQVW